eukprot:scaffold137_cov398-Prasinococcus_capsulatus_cf.AAC.52
MPLNGQKPPLSTTVPCWHPTRISSTCSCPVHAKGFYRRLRLDSRGLVAALSLYNATELGMRSAVGRRLGVSSSRILAASCFFVCVALLLSS